MLSHRLLSVLDFTSFFAHGFFFMGNFLMTWGSCVFGVVIPGLLIFLSLIHCVCLDHFPGVAPSCLFGGQTESFAVTPNSLMQFVLVVHMVGTKISRLFCWRNFLRFASAICEPFFVNRNQKLSWREHECPFWILYLPPGQS